MRFQKDTTADFL